MRARALNSHISSVAHSSTGQNVTTLCGGQFLLSGVGCSVGIYQEDVHEHFKGLFASVQL